MINNLEDLLRDINYMVPFDASIEFKIIRVVGFGVKVKAHYPYGNQEPVHFLVRDDRVILIDYDKELSEHDAAFLMHRVSGDVVCEECGKTFYKHPVETRILDQEDRPYLVRLCSGMLGKL